MGKQLEIPDNIAISFFCTHVGGIPTGNVHFTRCPVCGDSEKRSHRKRCYLLKKKNGWIIYCHNCGYSSSLLKFIKNFYPQQYDYVIKESVGGFFEDKKKDKNEDLSNLIESLNEKVTKKLKKKANPVKKYITENCIPLKKDCGNEKYQEVINEQIEILQKRRLKRHFIDKLFYAIDGNYEGRVIIPFYDLEQQPYYFQARATRQSQMNNKYTNWSDKNIEKPLYNEFHVDSNQPVYIVEGLIDSLFVRNSVATLGVKIGVEKTKKLKEKYANRIWILDNDEVGINNTIKLFNKGEKCFIMPYKYKNVKDLNDLAIQLKLNDLTEIINKNVYNGIEGVIEFTRR